MLWLIFRTLIAAVTIVIVSEISTRLPRIGALLISLPIISALTFIMIWFQTKNIETVSRLAKETLFLVPLGLIFFVPLAFCEKFHLTFWLTMFISILLTTMVMGAWLYFGPK